MSGIIPVIQKGLRWGDAPARRWPPQNPLQPLLPLVRQGCFDLIFSELSASDSAEPPDAPEPAVLMIDATDIKAHPTACSLNKGGVPPPDWGTEGGMTSKLHGVCGSKGGPLRLHLCEGQCSDFTGADVAHCNPLRPLCPRLPFCHPPSRHPSQVSRLVSKVMEWSRGLSLGLLDDRREPGLNQDLPWCCATTG